MKRLCLILGCAAALTLPSAAQVPGREFAGRWDLTVTRSDAVYPSWMEVTDKDNKVEVRAQDREGSVHPVPAEVVGGKLVVTMSAPANPRPAADGKAASAPRPARVWEFAAAGDGLDGAVKIGDAVQARIRGVRAPVLKRPAPAAWSTPEPLFNGKDLAGWETMNHTQNPRATENHWVAKNGDLVNEAKGHNIRTTRTFDDFKLHLEYNLDAGANSGIYLRGRYECQMPPPTARADGRPPGYAIYGMVAAAVAAPSAPGEWHAYDITLVGRYVTLLVDGVKLVDNQEIAGITGGALDSNEAEPGPIYFQGDHTGGIRYRNITISVPRRGNSEAEKRSASGLHGVTLRLVAGRTVFGARECGTVCRSALLNVLRCSSGRASLFFSVAQVIESPCLAGLDSMSADVEDTRSENSLVHRVVEFEVHAAAQELHFQHRATPT